MLSPTLRLADRDWVSPFSRQKIWVLWRWGMVVKTIPIGLKDSLPASSRKPSQIFHKKIGSTADSIQCKRPFSWSNLDISKTGTRRGDEGRAVSKTLSGSLRSGFSSSHHSIFERHIFHQYVIRAPNEIAETVSDSRRGRDRDLLPVPSICRNVIPSSNTVKVIFQPLRRLRRRPWPCDLSELTEVQQDYVVDRIKAFMQIGSKDLEI